METHASGFRLRANAPEGPKPFSITQTPGQRPGGPKAISYQFPERELRWQIKDVGGVWNPDKQAWEIRYDRAVALGLTSRIMDEVGC